MYDHYCPLVANAIGMNNYKWFYLMLLSMTLGLIYFWIMLWLYATRRRVVWVWILGLGNGINILFAAAMLLYHTFLASRNLTSYEYWNGIRYDKHGRRNRRKNPWARGCWYNVMDRLAPTEASYMLPELYHQGLLNQLSPEVFA